jgi:membrane protease subunit (stomatin/prohibitin family)
MQILGTNYVQYQTGQAMREAAVNPSGGAAGVGVGLGAGLGMGWTMVDAMKQGNTTPVAGTQPVQAQAVAVVACPKCGTQNPQVSKFCSSCGAKLGPPTVACAKCKAEVPLGVKFCSECGAPMAAANGTKKCGSCGKEVPAASKFCPDCGKQA